MTQQRSFSVCEDGCPASPSLGNARVPKREDPAVECVEPHRIKSQLDGLIPKTERKQLIPRDDPMLPGGKSGQFPLTLPFLSPPLQCLSFRGHMHP